jgi:hypothetical protein
MVTARSLPDVEQGACCFGLMKEHHARLHLAGRVPVDREVATNGLRQQGMPANPRIGINPENRMIAPLPLANDEIDLGKAARPCQHFLAWALDQVVEADLDPRKLRDLSTFRVTEQRRGATGICCPSRLPPRYRFCGSPFNRRYRIQTS